MVTNKKQIKASSQKSRASKSVDDEVAEQKIRPKRISKRERLEALLVEVFHAHWQAVTVKINAGDDVAKTRTDCIFASNKRAGARLARQYYAPARALKLASVPVDEVVRLTSAWFDAFCDYADEWLTKPSEIRNELCQLVAAEYVATSLPEGNSGSQGDVATVHPLPNEAVPYGDVYEISASGLSSGANLRICKSVAEPFSEAERREAMVGIEREFHENARADGEDENVWEIDFSEPIEPCVIDADVVMIG